MLFSVTGTYTEPGPLLSPEASAAMIEQQIIPSLEILAKWETEGKIRGGVIAGDRVGIFVLEAASSEEVGQLLTKSTVLACTPVGFAKADNS